MNGQEKEPQASQEEVRARLEEQIRKLRVEDMMVESVVSVLNLTARRIAKEDERDLAQAKVGIDAIRAWLDLLPEDAAGQIRNALSELQVLYAQVAEGAKAEGQQGEGEVPQPAAEQPQRGPQPPPRLWTPPGSS